MLIIVMLSRDMGDREWKLHVSMLLGGIGGLQAVVFLHNEAGYEDSRPVRV
jgi:hypothetical protein